MSPPPGNPIPIGRPLSAIIRRGVEPLACGWDPQVESERLELKGKNKRKQTMIFTTFALFFYWAAFDHFFKLPQRKRGHWQLGAHSQQKLFSLVVFKLRPNDHKVGVFGIERNFEARAGDDGNGCDATFTNSPFLAVCMDSIDCSSCLIYNKKGLFELHR